MRRSALAASTLAWFIAAFAAAQTPAARPRTVPKPAPPAATQSADQDPVVVRNVGPLPLSRDLTYRPLGEIKVPQPAVVTLSNGLRVFLLANHDLPLVRGGALVRTGNLFDPKDKRGLATLTGMTLRTGGTKNLDADQLDEKLESIAASIESSIDEGNGSVGFSCLRENTADVLGWFHDVLVEPAFAPDKVSLARTQLKSLISRRNDDAGSIASRESTSLVYGPDTPYGADEEYATVNAITRDDIRSFYTRYFFPANTILYVYGDFDASEMQRTLERLFAGWTATQEKVPPFPPVDWKAAPGIYFAQKDDVTQTFFEIGELGGRLDSKDYAAIIVAADVLGGGFSSRLFREVRSRLGYAYSIGASWDAQYDHPGTFSVSGSTKAESTTETLRAILTQINQLRNAEITDQELKTAKDTSLNSLVFAFERPQNTLLRLITYDYYGYPADFLTRYQRDLQAVTKADVLRVAKQYFQPDQLVIVAVGDQRKLGEPLSALKLPVKNLDISIPPDRPVLNEAQQDEGKQLLEKAFNFLGGRERLALISDFTINAETHFSGARPPATLTLQVIHPDWARQKETSAGGNITVFFRPNFGWIDRGDGNDDLPESALPALYGVLNRNPIMVIISMAKNPSALTYQGGETFEWAPAPDSLPLHLVFDPGTGALLRLRYHDKKIDAEDSVSDWRDVAGLKLPFRMTAVRNNKPFAVQSISEIKINTHLTREALSKRL